MLICQLCVEYLSCMHIEHEVDENSLHGKVTGELKLSVNIISDQVHETAGE